MVDMAHIAVAWLLQASSEPYPLCVMWLPPSPIRHCADREEVPILCNKEVAEKYNFNKAIFPNPGRPLCMSSSPLRQYVSRKFKR